MSRIEELMDLQEAVPPQMIEELTASKGLEPEEQQRIQQRCLQKIAVLQKQYGEQADCLPENTTLKGIKVDSLDKAAEKQWLQRDKHSVEGRLSHTKKARRWFTAVAICAMVFSLSTAAIGTLTTDTQLLKLFQADSQSQIAQLNEMSYQIGQSVTKHGYTVTVQEAISDRHNTWVLLDLKGPEGSKLDAERLYFGQTKVELERASSFGYAMSALPDDDPEDNCVSWLLDLSVRGKLTGQEITMSLENLGWYNYDAERKKSSDAEWETLIEGTWQFTFKVPQDETTVFLWQWRVLQNNEKYFLVHKMEVSPLSIMLDVSRLQWASYTELQEEPVLVYLKDGSMLELSCNSSSGSGSNMQFNYTFESPADLRNIDRIMYCGRDLNW